MEAAAASTTRSTNGSDGAKKKPRSVGDDHYAEPDPDEYRGKFNFFCLQKKFNFFWSYKCDFEDVTRGPMSHTDGDGPATMDPCLEIYSWEVTELRGGLEWPLDVFGFAAVRDSLDKKRNFVFNRSRDDPQRLTATDSCLELTGPVRAVQLCMPTEIEFQLRVKGETPSEDRILSTDFWAYDPVRGCHTKGASRTKEIATKFSTMALTFSHLAKALEATIQVKMVGSSSSNDGLRARFAAQMVGIDDEVVLGDFKERPVPVDADGVVRLSRRVVVVDGDGGVLGIRVNAWKKDPSGGCGYNGVDVANSVEDGIRFTARSAGRSAGTLDVGFAKICVTVFWSLLPFV